MDFAYGSAFLRSSPEAYERLLLDALLGDSTLFTRWDEVERAWEILDPLIQHWETDPADLLRVPRRDVGPGGRRPHAGARRPGVAAPVSGPGGWDGLGVSIAEVADRLAEQRRPPGGGAPYTLSGVLNLVAYAPSPEELGPMQEVIEGLADHQASRTILIAEAGEGSGMDATVSTSCRLAGDSTTMALELVVLTVHGETRAGTASACTPLLRSELPTFLWWPLPPDTAAGGALAGLLAVADRVVTEAGRGDDATAAVRALAEWIPGEDGPAVTDLAWAAITLVAPAPGAGARPRVAGGAAPARRRGHRPRRRRAGRGRPPAGRLAARLPRRGRGRPAPPGEGAGNGVLAVEVAGPTGRRLRVERLAGREAATVTVTEADGTVHDRTLPLPDPDRARLLAGELEIQRRDRAFERALARAPV